MKIKHAVTFCNEKKRKKKYCKPSEVEYMQDRFINTICYSENNKRVNKL